mgnify:CR=1 FL=1
MGPKVNGDGVLHCRASGVGADTLLAGIVRLLEQALGESAGFEPLRSRRRFRIHMSDIGEGRFLPPLMQRLRETAPGVRVETLPLRPAEIAVALDEGRIDFAFGFLPKVKDTRRQHLLQDRYIVLLRADHPFARRRLRGAALLKALRTLDYVAVRTHADTLRIQAALDQNLLVACDAEPIVRDGLDPGECAAIGRAIQIGAGLLADDHAARQCALELGAETDADNEDFEKKFRITVDGNTLRVPE